MSIEKNKELVIRFYETLEQANYDGLKEFCHKDFVFYPQLDTPMYGVEGLVKSEKKNFDAFSDSKMPIKSIIAEDDKVAVYLIFEGNHTGEWYGIPETGNKVRFSLMMFLRIADGKIIEKRSHVDVNDVIRQIKGNK